MVDNKVKDAKVIDTRFTFSGPRAKEFLEMVKEECGIPLPYATVRHYIRLACIHYLEARKKAKIKEDNNNGK